MTSIYDIPKEDIDIFIENNNDIIHKKEYDPYLITFKTIKSGNYLPGTVPDKIIDWIIAYNLIIKGVNIPKYNVLNIYLLSEKELKALSKLLKLDNLHINSVINVLNYLGKLDSKLLLESLPIDIIKDIMKDIENPENITNFCLVNKLYKKVICDNDSFWKEKYTEKYEIEGLNYLQNHQIKDYQELYKLNYSYHQLSKKLKFYRDFDFWYNVEELFMRNRKLKDFPEEIFLLPKLRILSLAQNNITYLPKNISKLTNLETLSLSRNKLITLPKEIGDLKKLKILNLNDNKLTYLPNTISKLNNLEDLHVTDNPNLYITEDIYDLPKLIHIPKESDRLYGYKKDIFILKRVVSRKTFIPKQVVYESFSVPEYEDPDISDEYSDLNNEYDEYSDLNDEYDNDNESDEYDNEINESDEYDNDESDRYEDYVKAFKNIKM